MYYMGFSYWECYNIPIQYRLWFIKRLNEEIKRTNEKGSSNSRAAHTNTPEARSLQGKARSQVPAKLRRFG